MGARAQLNLASRAFENRRPIRRLAVLIWSVAGFATALNLWLYHGYFSGSSEGRGDLQAIADQIREETTESRRLASELGSYDIEAQNEQVDFLNRKIADRTFPWGSLFDHLSEVLPRGVRLVSLAPAQPDERQDRSRGSRSRRRRVLDQEQDRVPLDINGEAEDSEQIAAFLDALFAHASFVSPVLRSESSSSAAGSRFSLQVDYLAKRRGAPRAVTQAAAGVAEGAASEAGTASHGVDGPLGNASGSPRLREAAR